MNRSRVSSDSTHEESFKKKGSSIQDRRALRHHRRSLEWKNQRDDKFDQRRNMEMMSPVKEVKSAPPSPEKLNTRQDNKAGNPSRTERLKKWKAEKELKKKLEAIEKARKQPFRVTHLVQEDIPFSKPLSSLPKRQLRKSDVGALKQKSNLHEAASNAKDPKDKKKVSAVPSRTTRSSSRTKAPQSEAPAPPSNARAPSRGTVPKQRTKAEVPKRVTRSSAANKLSTKNTEKPTSVGGVYTSQAAKGRKLKAAMKKEPVKIHSKGIEAVPALKCVTTKADASFAPVDFQFKAPASLESMVFHPLSPATTASFFPDSKHITESIFHGRCSTPKVSSLNGPTKLMRSPLISAISPGSASTVDAKQSPTEGMPPVKRMISPPCETTLVEKDEEAKKERRVQKTPRRKSTRLANSSSLVLDSDSNTDHSQASIKIGDSLRTKTEENSLVENESICNNSTMHIMEVDENSSALESVNSGKKSRRKSHRSALQVTIDLSSSEDQSATKNRKSRRQSTRRSVVVVQESTGVNADVVEKNEVVKSKAPQMSPEEAVSSTTALHDTDTDKPMFLNLVTKSTTPEDAVSSTMPDSQLDSGLSCMAHVSGKENKSDDNINYHKMMFTTPRTPPSMSNRRRRSRYRSAGHSVKKTPKNNRSSLILRALSPEDGIEVLKSSPMIELTRRKTPKSDTTASSMPSFDDLDEMFSSAESELMTNNTDGSFIEQPVTLKADPRDEQREEDLLKIAHFRQLLVTETARLNTLCDKWEVINKESNPPDEAQGEIRTSIGCAHLLIAQRFKQFYGLIDNSEFNTGEKEIHASDLQGFWDMIHFQVEDVDAKFSLLGKSMENNWEDMLKKAPVKKKIIKKKPAVKTASSKPAARSKFAAFRAQMKQTKTEVPVIEVVEVERPVIKDSPLKVCTESAPDSIKTFDAGFFQVHSPVSSPRAPSGDGLSSRKSPKMSTTPSSNKLLRRVLEKSSQPSSDNSRSENATPTAASHRNSIGMKRKLSEEEDNTPSRNSKRRSLRSESFINSNCPSLFTPAVNQGNQMQTESSLSSSQDIEVDSDAPQTSHQSEDFMQYLMQSSTDVDMAATMKRSLCAEFDEQSTADVKRKSTRLSANRLSLEKSYPSAKKLEKTASGRRKSRRGVQFQTLCSSPSITTNSIRAPVTPYNKDSLVSHTRRSSSSNSNSSTDKENSLLHSLEESHSEEPYTPTGKMSMLNMDVTPQSEKKTRLSCLLYTPFEKAATPQRMAVLSEDVPDSLMVFSPLATESSSTGEENRSDTPTPRRSRRSTRLSLL